MTPEAAPFIGRPPLSRQNVRTLSNNCPPDHTIYACNMSITLWWINASYLCRLLWGPEIVQTSMRFVMRFEALQEPFQPRETALQQPQALMRQTLVALFNQRPFVQSDSQPVSHAPLQTKCLQRQPPRFPRLQAQSRARDPHQTLTRTTSLKAGAR